MFPLLFALLFGMINTKILSAQTGQVSVATAVQKQPDVGQKDIMNKPETVQILNNFKATKQERKVITKVNKYVAPKILGRISDAQRAGLLGKVIKTQINFDSNGAITSISIIDGLGVKIDRRVKELIKDYDEKKSIGKELTNTSAIQLDVPLIGKKYYEN